MNKLISAFSLLALAAVLAFTPNSSQTLGNSSKKKKVFLLAGQSNMDGRADSAQVSLKDIERLHAVAHRIEFYYNGKPATPLKFTEATNYIKKKFSLEKSFGPELFFGIELAEKYPDDEFIIIKRSVGGTSLYGCWNPHWTEEKASLMGELNKPKLYFEFIEYTKNVLKNYNPNEYEIEGMLWVQGEADSGVKKYGPVPAETYGENLTNLIAGVRKELNIPKMPFVMFQVGSGKVVEGMKKVSKSDKNVYLIPQSQKKDSPDYYPINPPPLGHYVASSMKRIGEEFFKVYKGILLSEGKK